MGVDSSGEISGRNALRSQIICQKGDTNWKELLSRFQWYGALHGNKPTYLWD